MDSTGKICTLKNVAMDLILVNDFAGITDLVFQAARMPKMPVKIIDRFPPVQRLDMSRNYFNELRFDEIKNVSTLAILDFSSNNLTELPASTFSKTTNLKELYLSRNQIQVIPSTTFFNLPNLRLLDLSHNKIQSIAQDNMFGFLRSLRFIYLNHNGITRMRTSFGNVTNLVEFDGSHNDLKDWSLTFASGSTVKLNLAYCGLKNSYSSAADKEELNLEGNMIEVMKITGKVTRLRANNNIIRQVEIDPSIHLEALELANNYISDISNITKVEYLQVLDLSGNKLKNSIRDNVFSELTALTYLSLANTGATITSQLLEHNTRLLYLDISNNRIGNFDLKVLKYLTNLEILKLDSNEMAEIIGYDDVKEFLPELSNIGLSNNLFSCSYLQKLLKALQEALVEVSVPITTLEAILPNIKGLKCINDGKNVTDQLVYTENLINFQDESFKEEVRTNMRAMQDDVSAQKQLLNNHDAQLQDASGKIKDSIKELMTSTAKQLSNLNSNTGASQDILANLKELQSHVEALNTLTDSKLDRLSGNMNNTLTVDKLVMDTQEKIDSVRSQAKSVLVISVLLLLVLLSVSALIIKDKFGRRFTGSRSLSEQHLTL